MTPIELRLSEASLKAIAKLESQGLEVTKAYRYEAPSLPKDITSVGDENLMDLYAIYVSYLEFINLQVWCAQTDKSDAEKHMDLQRAKQRLMRQEKGKTAAIVEAEIDLDPEYRVLADIYQDLANYHKLMEHMSDKISKDISLINREITRRVNTNKVAGRMSSFAP